MASNKIIPYLRVISVSLLLFFGTALILNYVSDFVEAVYVFIMGSDVQLTDPMPDSFYVVTDILFAVLTPFMYYDLMLGDISRQTEFLCSVADRKELSFADTVKKLFSDKRFLLAFALIIVCAFVSLPLWKSVVTVISYLLATVAVRFYWFRSKSDSDSQPKKSNYILRLLKHIAIWVLDVFLAVLLLWFVRLFIRPIWSTVYPILLKLVLPLTLLCVAVYLLRRIRALLVRHRFIKALKQVAHEQGMELELPDNIYRSVLSERVERIVLRNKFVCFDCLLIPTLVRKIPLYFLGGGIAQRVHTYNLLKIRFFSRTKEFGYSFEPCDKNVRRIIIASPSPRSIFIGPPGNPTPAENGSEVDKALVYNGNAFCNYVRRYLDNERIKQKERSR